MWSSSPVAMDPPGLLVVRHESQILLPDWGSHPNPDFRCNFRPIRMLSLGSRHCRGLRRPWELAFPAAYPLIRAEQAWATPDKTIWLCLSQPITCWCLLTGWTDCSWCPMNRTRSSSRGSNHSIMHWDPGPTITSDWCVRPWKEANEPAEAIPYDGMEIGEGESLPSQ